MTRNEFEQVKQQGMSFAGFVLSLVELTFFRENPDSQDLAKLRRVIFDKNGDSLRLLEGELLEK